MHNLKYFLMDVFTENKYKGNPLAVFLSDDNLPEESMMKIVKDMNSIETTFITGNALKNSYNMRIFTPTSEIPYSGHPSLGTAYIIKEFILKENVNKINLQLISGRIPIELTYTNEAVDYLWLKQKPPQFGEALDKSHVLSILSLKDSDINENYPIQQVTSGGLPYYMIPVKDLKALRKIKINLKEYYEFVSKLYENKYGIFPTAFYAFSPEGYNKRNKLNLSARTFDDYAGMPEDAASGSACGCLMAYLLKYGFSRKNELNLNVEQGNEMNRPSLIKLKGVLSGSGKYDIRVGGKVQLIAQGDLYY